MTTAERQALEKYTQESTAGEEKSWSGHMADDVAATGGIEPTALLTATTESLVLTSTRGNFRIPRSAVQRLGRGNLYPWFFSALRIHHHVTGVPKSLQFKPLTVGWRAVQENLEALGYPVR